MGPQRHLSLGKDEFPFPFGEGGGDASSIAFFPGAIGARFIFSIFGKAP